MTFAVLEWFQCWMGRRVKKLSTLGVTGDHSNFVGVVEGEMGIYEH